MVKLALEAIEAASCGCTLRDFEALVVSTTPMIEDAMEDVMKIIRGEVKLKETEAIPTFVWDFYFQPPFRPSDSFQLLCGISVFTPNFG